ncbi:uncharacterized protein LOC131640483 [Vicia villosa]|uniref:uncharacterized protein LOC131640483 n=1 Tax=Vicia villosa TaxID=3911 RepID=UPI00273C2413|nr:uncharacterized protein LOC131640483 [Vicia villosa]XP_058766855.1 uncharacterized protein LOC131640483 [Vicia villosa]
MKGTSVTFSIILFLLSVTVVTLFTLVLVKYYSPYQQNDLKMYTILTEPYSENKSGLLLRYNRLIHQAANSDSASRPILTFNWNIWNGFVINLTKKEARRMNGLEGVVWVFPRKKPEIILDDETSLAWKENLNNIFYVILIILFYVIIE